jgi:flagellar biosynthesis regulator FlaF
VSVTLKTLLDMTKLKDIKEFNMLQRNLELTKALQDVDRLTAEIIDAKEQNNVWINQILDMQNHLTELEEEIVRLKAERLKSNL